MPSKLIIHQAVGYKEVLITCLILAVLLACSAKKVVRVEKISKEPSWVRERPVSSSYYSGIGLARIDKYGGNHIEIAKKNALNDLISEISVTVSSNSILRQFENNTDFQEEFEIYSKASIQDDIEEFELVDSWSDEDKYWVYYRLSKETYREIKNRKLERAKALANDLFLKAQEKKKNQELAQSISFHVKALEAIKNYFDEDLTLYNNERKIYLGNEILYSLIETLGQIDLEIDTAEIKTKISKPVRKSFLVTAKYQNKAIRSLPLRAYFKKGKGEVTPSFLTNNMGSSSFQIHKIVGTEKFQEVAVEIDLKSMINQVEKASNIITELIALKSTSSKAKVRIEVDPIVAFYSTKEIEFGKLSKRYTLSNEMKKFLSENYFLFTRNKEQADVIITLDSKATKGKYNEKHNLYTVFIDCYLSIVDAQTNNKIYYKGFDQVRGQQVGVWDNGLKDAQQNVLTKVKTDILPEIHDIDF